MKKSEKYDLVKDIVKEIQTTMKELYDGTGTYENPVDTDMVKTMKAIGYERILEVIKA